MDIIALKRLMMNNVTLPNSLPFASASVQNKSKPSTKLSPRIY
jgi:hypothetical protein